MIAYILKSGLCLVIFFSFYKLFLERENMHHIKRYYLLGMLVLAFTIPLVTFTTYVEVPPTSTVAEPLHSQAIVDQESLTNEGNSTTTPLHKTNYTTTIIWSIYGIICFLFLLKFVFNLSLLLIKAKTCPKFYHKMFTNVMVNENISPHTFFNYIFINREKFVTRQIPQEVFWHEQTHATQKHSIDILFIELLKVVFWFNPFLYFISKSIKLNHEFLADQAVLNKGVATSKYQHTLLTFSNSQEHPPLANAINYSSIKKRFTAMKTPTSKNKLWIKSMLIFPLIAILLVAFSQKETVEKELAQVQNQNNSPSISTTVSKEATEKMMKEYSDFMNEYARTKRIDLGKLYRVVSIYDLMSENQRKSVEKYPKGPSMDITKMTPKKPTREQYESWKNKEEFALWSDGKVIDNKELDNISISEVYHFTGSGVMNNARSERFPQPYQFHLYSKEYYTEKITKANLNGYNYLVKTYENELKLFLNSDRSDNSELLILKHQIDKTYEKFSEKQIKEWDVKIAPPLPATKENTSQKAPPPPPVPASEQKSSLHSPKKQVINHQNKVNANTPKHLIQHDVKLTNHKGEVYYEKSSVYTAEDKQLIPTPPSPEKPKTTGANQETINLEQYTYQMKAGENMSPETKLIHDKYESFLLDNPNYVSWMQIIDLNTKTVQYSVHPASEKAPNNLRKTTVEFTDRHYVCYMDFGQPYDRAKDELADLNNKSVPKKTYAKNAAIPIKEVEVVPVFPGCTGSLEEVNKCSKREIGRQIMNEFRVTRKNKKYVKGLKKDIIKFAVNFNIDKTGNIVNITFPKEIKTKLLGPIEPGEVYEQNTKLQDALGQAVKTLPKFEPGKQNGEIVAVSYGMVGTLNNQ